MLIALHALIYQHGHVHFIWSDDRCIPLKAGGTLCKHMAHEPIESYARQRTSCALVRHLGDFVRSDLGLGIAPKSTWENMGIWEDMKLLRFAKSNSDVHLRFPPLGRLEDLRLTCMFDAALGVRHDQASQGGFVILLTNKNAFEGVETPYHVLEWRSFKLPRIARSSLSAEAQSAATAVDSTEFVVRFWHMIFNPQDSLKVEESNTFSNFYH